jgi:hypothetical protein
MARIYTTEIDGDEYIGESLEKINGNFQGLDSQQQTLSAVIASINFETNLALELVTAALTGVRDINIRLNDRGVFYSPNAFYVSLTGNDSEKGSIAFPYLTLDKAINEITNVAKNTPTDPSKINKRNDFYIFLKDPAVYQLSSTVTLANIPGTVHIVGSTMSDTITATMVQPSTTFHDDDVIPNFVFDTSLGEQKLKDYRSLKVYQTFGKNAIPIPGYVTYSSGLKGVHGFNAPSFKRLLSAINGIEDIQNDRYYNYIIAGNEVKQIERVTNDNYFEVTTPFSSTVSGVPVFIGNKNNWHYSATDTLQRLSAANNTNDYASYNTNVVIVTAQNNASPPVPYSPGNTKFETGNIFHFNGKAALVVKAYQLSSVNNNYTGRVYLDDVGSLFTERLSSKTQLDPTNVSVQGVVGSVPFFEKTFFELYRGVYDRVEYDSVTIQASAGNYQRATANSKYNTLLSNIKIPRSFSIKMPVGSGLTYIQPLPTTIWFTNTGSAGFKLIGTSLHLQNVYVRGPRTAVNTVDIIDTENIGVQASNNSIAVIDSDSAIANFSIGLHATNSSSIIVEGDVTNPVHIRNALTITDNSIGAIIENDSSLLTNGSRLIIAQNFRNGLVVQNNSKAYLQFVDIFHNGDAGITAKSYSNVSIGSINLIGNRYGALCTHNSSLTITPKLLQNTGISPDVQPYPYYSPNLIYCNSTIDREANGITISQNSSLTLEEVSLVKNALSGSTIKIEDTSTGYLDYVTLFSTRNNSIDNQRYGIGINTSNNHLTIKNTSIFDAPTAIKVNPNANLALQNIFISRANVGIGLTENTNTSITFTNYPSSNNVINAANLAVYIEGNQNIFTSYMECTNFRLSSVVCMGLNNYCAAHTDLTLKTVTDLFTFPVDARNAFNSRDSKIRTASYPRFFPRSGALDPFGITY